MHTKNTTWAGAPLHKEGKVLILLHGRGGSAADILSLGAYLHVNDFTLLAPQATNATWYPYSFLAPQQQNEPWLSGALQMLVAVTDDLYAQGLQPGQLYFAGFSQGACLMLEFLARHAKEYGGAVAFTGGLIGDKIDTANYKGSFGGTPIFIGTSNPDPHVPVERVEASAKVLTQMGAAVTTKIYTGMGHTISQEELEAANKLVFKA
jgi:phospholipase/carboxylesterase